ncbi:MAG: M10 family metallopeptidase C-terminal domain-containing protein, partial [Pseudomonadota bacterium]
MTPNPVLVNALLSEYETRPTGFQSGAEITYGWLSASEFAARSLPGSSFFAVMEETQRARIDAAFQEWGKVLNVSFRRANEDEVPSILVGSADLRDVEINGVRELGGYQVHQFLGPNDPSNFNIVIIGTHLDPARDGSGLLAGSGGFNVLLHEIGHALGLSHPGNNVVAIAPQDNRIDTVMSYLNPEVSYARANYGSISILTRYPASPMRYDVFALQSRLGANQATGGPDTQFVFATQASSLANTIVSTIFDAGGLGDTIDASTLSAPVYVSLIPGSASSIGSFDSDLRNVVIAFGSVIENAKGGSGNDVLIGNAVVNRLEGNAGADRLDGGTVDGAGFNGIRAGQGDGVGDTLIGGAGADVFILREGGGLDTVDDDGVSDRIEFRDLDDKPVALDRTAFRQAGAGTNEWVSPDGRWRYRLSSPLQIERAADNAVLASVANYAAGDYGIRLIDAPSAPATTRDIVGDLEPLDADPGTPGVQTTTDDLGNIVLSANPAVGQADSVNDSAGNDQVATGEGDDVVNAFRGGDDRIRAGGGRDSVTDDAGNDYVEGGLNTAAGGDIVYAGAGNDVVFGDDAPADLVAALSGSLTDATAGASAKGDFLSAGAGDDLVLSGAENDVLVGGGGRDVLASGAGDDHVLADADLRAQNFDWTVTATGDFRLFGPTTGDLVAADGAADSIYTGAGNDWADAGVGSDYLDLGAGNDTAFGAEGSDTLLAGEGDDRVFGDFGALGDPNFAAAEQGNDLLDLGAGDDFAIGNGGADTILGGDGNDTMLGDLDTLDAQYHGADILDGGAGEDLIDAHGGNDQITGGPGNDTLIGGAGKDSYVFNVGDGVDTI